MKLYALILASILVAGCCPPVKPDAAPTTKRQVNIDRFYTEPCADLAKAKLPDGPVSAEQVLKAVADIRVMYAECRLKQAGLTEALDGLTDVLDIYRK